MSNEPKTPSAEALRKMSYSELKKIAKQRGIKGNLKTEKMIIAITSAESDDADSFSTPAANVLNSSRKNKLEKFDDDSMTPLVTPRRGTYSIGSSMVLKENETTPSSVVNESSVLDISNVTVGRGSERKLRKRKVSFLSPVMTPHTPKNSNLKLRPKTPIVSRTPLTATAFPSPMKELKVDLEEPVNVSLHLTPLPEKTSDTTCDAFRDGNQASTSLMTSSNESTKNKINDTAKSTSLLINNNVSAKKKQIATPMLTRSLSSKNELSKKKRIATPNFKKIHEKAIEKMESIDDYQKRVVNSAKKMGVPSFKPNKITKAKSKIPAFGGIPFIPSVSKCSTSKWDASASNKSKQLEDKRKPKKDAENVNTRSKTKFDLKASLSRKLGYKPYTGPLKPLTPSTRLNTSSSVCVHKNKETPAKEPVNKVVTAVRMKNRSLLKGVRTNKRFELQMKNRKFQ